ncbi:uncharacterized protein LOC129457334 [Periophthalmus magnuspinnatus]|uniref:uncharacterized protein LOC129457334 n=1 Tax=Periophthalmus magnuspinnatus TaxID=409849 RepID=UPI002436512C|nr:uncharacterized protein LOC129457334 [Periophthalmus magnuspinnatus]
MSLLHGRSLGSRPSQPRTTKLLLSTRSPKVAMIRPPVRPPTKSNEDWAAVLGPDAEREARESRNKSEKHLNFNREPSAWRERREMNILRRESKRHKSRRDKNNCTFKCGALKLESEEDLGLKQKTDLCSGDKMIHRRSNMDKSTGHRRTFKSNMSLIKNNKLFTLGSKNNIESGGREREEQKRSRPEESRGGTTLRQRELGRRRQRRSVAQVQEDRASLRSCSVKSWRWSLVKSRSLCQSQCGRAVTSQQLTCRRPIREEHCSEEETGSEGEHSGMGGVRRQHLVRIKASQNLKKRIQRLKSGTFTLMTTV